MQDSYAKRLLMESSSITENTNTIQSAYHELSTYLLYRCPWRAMKVSNTFGDVTTMFQERRGWQEIDNELLIRASLHDSPFFPKLISIKKAEAEPDEGGARDQIATLELERVVPFVTVAKYYPRMFEPEYEDHLYTIFLNIMLDLLGALITMHEKGISYGRISQENFGWNTTKQIWQLSDLRDSKFDASESEKGSDFYYLYYALSYCLRYSNYEVFRKYPNPLDKFYEPFKRINTAQAKEKIKQIYCDAFVAYAESAIGYGRLNPPLDKSISASRRIFYEHDLFK